MQIPVVFRDPQGFYQVVSFRNASDLVPELTLIIMTHGEDCCAMYPPKQQFNTVTFMLYNFLFYNLSSYAMYIPKGEWEFPISEGAKLASWLSA
jgi:hypothetical protein